MDVREALRTMAPSLALQRAASDELAKADKRVKELEAEVASLEEALKLLKDEQK